jgi:hypothetical protein
MILLVLFLLLTRPRRTELKIEIDLQPNPREVGR